GRREVRLAGVRRDLAAQPGGGCPQRDGEPLGPLRAGGTPARLLNTIEFNQETIMKGNLKITALAAAAAMFAMGTASAQSFPQANVDTSVATDLAIWGDIEAWGSVEVGGYLNVGGDINLVVDYDYNDNYDRNFVENITNNQTTNVNHTEDT